MPQITCIRCGCEFDERAPQSKTRLCYPCTREHIDEAKRAIAAVRKEIYHKRLARADTHICVDCAAAASVYEHRDYTKPLDIEPVCRSCNHKRGIALDSRLRSIAA